MFHKVLIGAALLAFALADPIVYDSRPAHLLIESRKVQDNLPYPYTQNLEPKNDNIIYADNEYYLVPEEVKPHATHAVIQTGLGLVSLIVNTAVALVKKAAVFLISHLPALIVGGLVAEGICRLTPFCSGISSINSWREVRSLATPERLESAKMFLERAIAKFNEMQQ